MTFEQYMNSLKDYSIDEIIKMIIKSGGKVWRMH